MRLKVRYPRYTSLPDSPLYKGVSSNLVRYLAKNEKLPSKPPRQSNTLPLSKHHFGPLKPPRRHSPTLSGPSRPSKCPFATLEVPLRNPRRGTSRVANRHFPTCNLKKPILLLAHLIIALTQTNIKPLVHQ